MTNRYDELYKSDKLYWGTTPSKTCDQLIEFYPAKDKAKLLVLGCGEGRNAIYLAKHGYEVRAFDLSPNGIEKTKKLAEKAGVGVEAFVADIREYRLTEPVDLIFCTGALHYLEQKIRSELLENYKAQTNSGGLHVLSVFTDDPSVEPAPDADPNAHLWKQGELASLYSDWQIESASAEIFDCNTGGQPHQHATDRIIARNI